MSCAEHLSPARPAAPNDPDVRRPPDKGERLKRPFSLERRRASGLHVWLREGTTLGNIWEYGKGTGTRELQMMRDTFWGMVLREGS
jgi:hypothetical protein